MMFCAASRSACCSGGAAVCCWRRGTHSPPCWRVWGSWVSCLQRLSCGPDHHSSPGRGWSGRWPAGARPGQQQQHLHDTAARTGRSGCCNSSSWARAFVEMHKGLLSCIRKQHKEAAAQMTVGSNCCCFSNLIIINCCCHCQLVSSCTECLLIHLLCFNTVTSLVG